MSLDTVTPEDKKKLTSFIDAGISIMQQIADLREGLNDTAKNLGEEMEIKPMELKRAVRVAFKASLEEEKDKLSLVEDILHVSGR